LPLSKNQKHMLAATYRNEDWCKGKPSNITDLTQVFETDDCRSFWDVRFRRSMLFQTRRLIHTLIRRGLASAKT
jgi:hypothetical protein